MNGHVTTNAALYFVVYNADGTVLEGVTPLGLQTHSGMENFISADSEQDAMGQANAAGVDFTGYHPLPEVGEPVAAGTWSYGSELVVCRQAHDRTIYPPNETPALFSTYRDETGSLEWIANEAVLVGTLRMYNGVQYFCIQAHQTQIDWTPDVVPTLWRVESSPTGEWTVGEAVEVGDVRSYESIDYECLQAHTCQVGWEPPNVPALWGEI